MSRLIVDVRLHDDAPVSKWTLQGRAAETGKTPEQHAQLAAHHERLGNNATNPTARNYHYGQVSLHRFYAGQDALTGYARGMQQEAGKERAHGIKPGHTIRVNRMGAKPETVHRVSGNMIHTTAGNMYHATKVVRA